MIHLSGGGRGYENSLRQIPYLSKKLFLQQLSLQRFKSNPQMQLLTLSGHI